MTRMCFMKDDDGHAFAIPVDSRGFFSILLERGMEDEDYSDFENEFGEYQLNRPISSYSFENLKEED